MTIASAQARATSGLEPIDLQQADAAMSLKTWWALLFILPLSRRLVVFVVNRTRITPNQITFAAMGLRLVTAISFFSGTRAGLLVGAFSYYLAYVCDCADGTVARLTGQSSELGRYLDHVADLAGDVIILMALAWSQQMLMMPMVLGMLFMHVAECYISYLTGFALGQSPESGTDFVLFKLVNRYRNWWFSRNIKSFLSFPDYNAVVFVFCPLLGVPAAGLRIGFGLLVIICFYTVLSTFVSIHSGIRKFP